MKSKVTIEDAGTELQLDLSPLKNRLVGKRIWEIERCLIEVLGVIRDEEIRHWEWRGHYRKDMDEVESWRDFMDVYKEYSGVREDFLDRFSSISRIGRFFWNFLTKLEGIEGKQLEAGKDSTVFHARVLAQLIVREIDMAHDRALKLSEEVDRLYEKWMGHSLTGRKQ